MRLRFWRARKEQPAAAPQPAPVNYIRILDVDDEADERMAELSAVINSLVVKRYSPCPQCGSRGAQILTPMPGRTRALGESGLVFEHEPGCAAPSGEFLWMSCASRSSRHERPCMTC
jgi:hypothetical protein